MKRIVMLEAMCWNEKSWARIMSKSGKVSLLQHGFGYTERSEWEAGRAVLIEPKKRAALRFTFLDEMTFGFMITLGTLKDAWPIMKGRRADVVIASANSMALAALILRAIGKTKKVVCLIGDYFPPKGSLAVRTYRYISTSLTTWLARRADEVWSISPRIPMTYANPRNFLVPVWIESADVPSVTRDEIGYIGMPSQDHALEILFEVCRKHGLRLNIIGDSPYLQSIKASAPSTAVFHGMIADQAKISSILSRCFCGYAVYRNTGPQNYSYYGFPSKMLAYFASNTPVVTTDTADFMKEIEKFGIGRVVEPQFEQIEKAILDIKTRPADFHEAIERFRKTWNESVVKFHQERLAALFAEE